MASIRGRWLLSRAAILCTTTFPAVALAQTVGTPAVGQNASLTDGGAVSTDGGASALAEVVVTANKRSQDLQRTPAAVSVVGRDALEQGGISDPVQLSKLVPSLVIGKQSASAVVFLRGVGQTNSSPAAQPGVSTNIDGVYLPRELAGAALFDLERVEVLPGPQGTLYGRNAAGGAVNLVTRKPSADFNVESILEIGNFSMVHGFGAVNAPLGGTVAVRAAVDVNRHDGYLSNGANDEDSVAGRLSVSAHPIDGLSMLLQYEHSHDGGLGPQNIARGTAQPPFGSATDPYFDSFPSNKLYQRNNGNVLTGEVGYEFDNGVSLTYLPGYLQGRNDSGVQFSGVVYSLFRSTVEQYSQELRLSSNSTDRLKWLAGLFWYKASSSIEADVGDPAFNFVRIYNDMRSYAAFGEATWSLTDTLRLTAGGRFSSDTYDGHGSQVPPETLFGAKHTADRPDWKLGLEYDLAARSLLYASAQSGYLQGGFTQADLQSTQPHTFQPEKLTAFSAGSKNRFLDNQLQVNDEVFYYDYRDYQLQTIPYDPSTGTTIFLVVNVPKARIFGDQLDLAYSAGRNTDFRVSLIYLNAKITRGLAGSPSYDGFQLPDAPQLTANLAMEQRFPLANGSHLSARIASIINSGYWTVFTHDDFSHQDHFTKTDINFTYYAAHDHWSVGAFVRNVENSVTYYGSSSGGGPGSPLPTFIDVPRTYGVRGDLKL